MLKVIPITTRYYETLNTTRSILDKRVRVEISALREMCEKKRLSNTLVKKKQHQLSDVLTKKMLQTNLL